MMVSGAPNVGALMVGFPCESSVMRRSRSVAPSATNPSAAFRLKARAKGLVLKSLVPTASFWTPKFMLSVFPLGRKSKASASCTVSITERQLWTFTLKRNGPFGDEQVPETYARLPRTMIDSSRLGNAPVTLSNVIVSGSRARCSRPTGNRCSGSGSGSRS